MTNKAYETRQISTNTRERKRRASDRADAPVSKRLRERIPTLADRYLKSPLSVLDEHADIQFVRPHDKGFPTILDNIRHAHHTLEELAPKSAKDLAALQQDWADHGFPIFVDGEPLRCPELHLVNENVSRQCLGPAFAPRGLHRLEGRW